MQDVFDKVYSLLVFVNIRVILYKTYVVLICGKYNTLTLEFKINIATCVPLHLKSELLRKVFSDHQMIMFCHRKYDLYTLYLNENGVKNVKF